MKKTASIILVVIVLLSLVYQTASAQGTLELLEARNDTGGNVIFVFRFSGDFSRSDFAGGKLFFGDMQLSLDCNIVDAAEGLVQCTTSRAAADQNVRIVIGGFVFWAYVPPSAGAPAGASTSQYCYNVYDLNEGQNGMIWFDFADQCQSTPASDGAVINILDYWDNPGQFEFDPGGSDACPLGGPFEDAYYRPCNFD